MQFRQCFVWALALMWAGGCATSRPEKLSSDSASDLRQARIEYCCGGSVTGGVAPVSHNEGSERTPQAVTTIEYPHPDGDVESALVTVVEHVKPGTTPKTSRLASFGSWTDQMLPGLVSDERIATAKGLKISKQELDAILREFVSEGGLESATDSRVAVSVQINGYSQTSHPKGSSALQQLTERVKSEGLLLPADHPHLATRLRSSAPTDDFYSSLESQAETAASP